MLSDTDVVVTVRKKIKSRRDITLDKERVAEKRPHNKILHWLREKMCVVCLSDLLFLLCLTLLTGTYSKLLRKISGKFLND